jgi:hypothetical protein
MPDLRYFEMSGDGKYRWIPNAELGRRETARNPPRGIPPELAEDPSLLLGGLEDAFEILADHLGDPGGVLAQAGKVAGEAEVGARGAYLEMRDGIEGADDSAGLLGEEALHFFQQHGELRKDYGIFFPDRATDNFDASNEWAGGVPTVVSDQYRNIAENPSPTQEMLDEYRGFAEGDPDVVGTGGRLMICDIISLPADQPYDDKVGEGQFPVGTVLKSGVMWACYLGDGTLRPVRVRLEFQMPTDANYEHQVVELIADEYRQVGPAVLAHRVTEKFFLDGESKGAAEMARDFYINQGSPTQQEIIERVRKRMQDMSSSLGQ